jgi:hypothetical protein
MRTSDIATLSDLIAFKNEIIEAIRAVHAPKEHPRFVNGKVLGEITGIRSYNSLMKNFGVHSKKVGGKLLFDLGAVTKSIMQSNSHLSS